ncbi:hypothetical protein Tco_0700933, partial [Tanacetum coccineum]
MLVPKLRSIYNGRPSFANPKYLKKAQSEKPCLYEIPYDKDDLANIFAPGREETLTLKQESRSKLHKETVKPYLEYVRSLEKEVDKHKSEKANFSNEYDLLLQEYVSKDVMCSLFHSLSDLDEQSELQ